MKRILYLIITSALLAGVLFNSCKETEFKESNKTLPLKLKYSIKGKGHLKSGVDFDLKEANLTLADNDGTLSSYTTENLTDETFDFEVPDGEYSINSLDVYDSSGKKILYYDKNQPDFEIECWMGDCGEIELSVVVEAVPFNWETATFVANDNSLPRLPWISGASTGVPREKALNHKRADGWVMLHHTFKYVNDNGEPRRKYMLLYNKYTGIMRMWYWHEGSSAYTSLKYGIQITAHSSMLNFNGEFALPMDIRKPLYSEYYSGDENIPASQGLTNNTWYMFDYEFAYDNNAHNISLAKSDLLLSTRGVNIDLVKLEGLENGRINGQIVLNAPGANLFNLDDINFDNSIDNSSSIESSKATTENAVDWWNKIEDKVSDQIADKLGNVPASLLESVLNLGTDPVTDYFSSLIHQGLESKGYANLSIATQIKLKGTITNQNPVSNINLHVPGINEETGVEYLYDKVLGVFNLNTTPEVYYQQTYYHKATTNPRYFQYYKINRNSFSFVINPEIADKITILDKKTELYFYKRYQGGVKLEKLGGIGPVKVGAQNKLVYATKIDTTGVFLDPPSDLGHEYYKFNESTVPPVASTAAGLCWEKEYMNEQYFQSYPVLDPDKRFVVKAILRFKIKNTGRIVTLVKTYLPKYIYNQTMLMSY